MIFINENISILTKCLLEGDDKTGWDIIYKEHQRGLDSLAIFHKLISGSMYEIGELWETNQITVADEHLATMTCDFLLSRYKLLKLNQRKTRPFKGKAMLFCVEEERHYLGLKMVQILFEECGWETTFLGASLPLQHFKQVVSSWKPDVICLSFSLITNAIKLKYYLNELSGLSDKPLALIGGRLVSTYDFTDQIEDSGILMRDLIAFNQWLMKTKAGGESIG